MRDGWLVGERGPEVHERRPWTRDAVLTIAALALLGLVLAGTGCAGKVPPTTVPVSCEQLRSLEAIACASHADDGTTIASAACLAAHEAAKGCADPADPCAGKTPICRDDHSVDCWERHGTECAFIRSPAIPPPGTCPAGQHYCTEHGGGCLPDDTECGPYVPPPPAAAKGTLPPVIAWDAWQAAADAGPARLGEGVNQAIRDVTGCDGGRCVVRGGPRAYLEAVGARLRALGWDAGQLVDLVDGATLRYSDELVVHRREVVVGAPAAPDIWESFHVYVGDGHYDGSDARPELEGTVLFFPQAYRGAYRVGATPETPPPPGPPGPPQNACGSPTPPPIHAIGLNLHPYPNRTVVDATKLVHGCESETENYCALIGLGTMPTGGARRCDCPVRAEGSPERVPCEEALGPIAWTASAGFLNEANASQWIVPIGAGRTASPVTVTACVHAVCASIEVTR